MLKEIFRSVFRVKIIQYIAMVMITYNMLYGEFIDAYIAFSTENSFGKIALGLSIAVLVIYFLRVTVLSDKLILFERSFHFLSIVFFGLGIYSGVSKDNPFGNNEFINYVMTFASYIIKFMVVCAVVFAVSILRRGIGDRDEKIEDEFEERSYYEDMLYDYEWFSERFVIACNQEESYIVVFDCEDNLVRIVDGETVRIIKTCSREQFQKMVKSGMTGFTIKDRLFGVIRVLKCYDYETFVEFAD